MWVLLTASSCAEKSPRAVVCAFCFAVNPCGSCGNEADSVTMSAWCANLRISEKRGLLKMTGPVIPKLTLIGEIPEYR